MQIFKGIRGLPQALSASVLTIGNFDGVHRGHQELVKRLISASRRLDCEPVVMTFQPHPSRILTPERPVLRIFDEVDQRERLELLGVKILIEEPFTKEFSRLPAAEFFEQNLRRPLSPQALIVGHDFSFGADRQGGHEMLKKLCAEQGIELEIVPALSVESQIVSSSQIRQALTRGDVDVAEKMLGRAYYLKGEVLPGHQRGRSIGVPTANLRPLVEFLPRSGVYISQTRVGSQTFPSITNLGVNPTFQGENSGGLKLETHLFDFAGDLYGREIRVELLKFLRDEVKFDGVEALKAQIDLDLAKAREFFRVR